MRCTLLLALLNVVRVIVTVTYNLMKAIYVYVVYHESIMEPVGRGRYFDFTYYQYREHIPGWTGWHAGSAFVLSVGFYVLVYVICRLVKLNGKKKGITG